jgi:hypothetical protein
MPLAGCDPIVGPNRSWHSGVQLDPTEELAARGQDLHSLFDYRVEKGRIKK